MRELREWVSRKNPGIDPRLVEKHERLVRDHVKIGVETKPEYDLESSLGQELHGYKYTRRR